MSMSCNIQFRAGKLIKEKKSASDAETEVTIKMDVTADSNKEPQMEKKTDHNSKKQAQERKNDHITKEYINIIMQINASGSETERQEHEEERENESLTLRPSSQITTYNTKLKICTCYSDAMNAKLGIKA